MKHIDSIPNKTIVSKLHRNNRKKGFYKPRSRKRIAKRNRDISKDNLLMIRVHQKLNERMTNKYMDQ